MYCLFGLIAIISMSLVPGSSENMKKIFNWQHMLRISSGMIFTVFFFYFTVNMFFEAMASRKTFVTYLKISIIAAFASIACSLLANRLFPGTSGENRYGSSALMLFYYSLDTLFLIGVSLLTAYLTTLRDGQKQRKILEAQKMQLEIEKSQANFNFLKAQINPHFLHNTLNFLYARSLPYSPELSEGILTLSDIMRYALSEGNARDGKAPLVDEIEHVRNVIRIQQLRFSNNLKVHFEVEGVLNGTTIIPFVLITLVENAFKHGDLKNAETPIDIRLRLEKGLLYFYCRNKKKTGPKELSTGIGLENIRKRLELAYGDKHSLVVKEDAAFYTTELTIQQL
jgi:two-component system LytT family sensor kinase